MGRGVHCHGRGSADLRWRDAPPIFFGLAKENGPCTVQKKNAFRPNLPVRASLGMRTADSQLSADLPSSIQVRCNAPVHPRLCRKLRRNISFQGACQCVQLLFPLPLRGGSFQRGGRSPLFVSFEGEVQEGETEIPLLACLLDRARPAKVSRAAARRPSGGFSPRGENGGCIAHLHRGVTSAPRCGQRDNPKTPENNLPASVIPGSPDNAFLLRNTDKPGRKFPAFLPSPSAIFYILFVILSNEPQIFPFFSP